MIETKDKTQEVLDASHIKLYKRYPITLVRGEGAYVWDSTGKKYIDALAGIAVNSLGHCYPKVVEAIQQQAARLIHTSNLYYNEPQAQLAGLLTEHSKLDRVFFCNSGAEAVEGAVKLARKHGHKHGKKGHILSMENCFHGRTIGTIAMGKQKYQKGFTPMPEGFAQIPHNDINALKKAVNDDTVAIILETVQGEGGIHVTEPEYLKAVREVCDQHGALMILDEIQCGIGRTGSLFAFHQYDLTPDIVTSAKALGSGFPIGAVLAKEKVAEAFDFGDHGTTYGGGPLACAAGSATIQTMLHEGIPERAQKLGDKTFKYIHDKADGHKGVKEIRGKGMMIGVDLTFKGAKIVERMMHKGVLANCTMDTTIRLVPPLTIKEEDMMKVIDILFESINEEMHEQK